MYICFLLSSRGFAPKVNADSIVMSDDEIDALDAQPANELTRSAINLQPVELAYHHYKEVWLSVERITEPTTPLREIQHSDVRDVVALTRVPGCIYHGAMITAMWPVECNPTFASTENAVGEKCCGNVEK